MPVERIAIDRATQVAFARMGDHGDQYPAVPANQEVGLSGTLTITPHSLRFRLDPQQPLRIGYPCGAMARTEIAIAGARHEFTRCVPGIECPAQRAAMTTAGMGEGIHDVPVFHAATAGRAGMDCRCGWPMMAPMAPSR